MTRVKQKTELTSRVMDVHLPRVFQTGQEEQSIPEGFLESMETCLNSDDKLRRSFLAAFPFIPSQAEFIEVVWAAMQTVPPEAIAAAAYHRAIEIRKLIEESAADLERASNLYPPPASDLKTAQAFSEFCYQVSRLNIFPTAETMQQTISETRGSVFDWMNPVIRHAVAIPKANGLTGLSAGDIAKIMQCAGKSCGKGVSLFTQGDDGTALQTFHNHVHKIREQQRSWLASLNIPARGEQKNGDILERVFPTAGEAGREDRRQGPTPKDQRPRKEANRQSRRKSVMVARGKTEAPRKAGTR